MHAVRLCDCDCGCGCGCGCGCDCDCDCDCDTVIAYYCSLLQLADVALRDMTWADSVPQGPVQIWGNRYGKGRGVFQAFTTYVPFLPPNLVGAMDRLSSKRGMDVGVMMGDMRVDVPCSLTSFGRIHQTLLLIERKVTAGGAGEDRVGAESEDETGETGDEGDDGGEDKAEEGEEACPPHAVFVASSKTLIL